MRRGARPVLVARLPQVVGFHHDQRETGGMLDEHTVTLAPFPLTTAETALWYQETEHKGSYSYDESQETQRLYRIGAGKLTKLLELSSSSRSGETGDGDVCTLALPATGAAMPDLAVHCVSSHSTYPGEHGTDHDSSSERDETYVWKRGSYVKN